MKSIGVGLFVLVVLCFCLVFYIGTTDTRRLDELHKIVTTRVLVVQWADALSAQRRADGLFERYTMIADEDYVGGALLPEMDSWGQSLIFVYTTAIGKGSDTERLVVYSSGPDRIRRTSDDISEFRLAVKRLK